ncbi:aminotransferase class I/II-fold pyridoxal phosphate-dependent enzyme [Calderihabitans maritimus]|uniref:Aluminum resistance family protein n=1 Tax=Calderihabitans maritimus TaxID=1246530 RepID=A0A1Z5HQC8_9FIRM|nr:methionine gamma-lyase family protein [Calderihabitans maritimus]GAW91480.1 aluminum resistance family protein [Calderihabitans maritimus]
MDLNLLHDEYGVDTDLLDLALEVEEEITPEWKHLKKIASVNHLKVLTAFKQLQVSSHHLLGSTGYGYGDVGRETLDALYAKVFRAEKALVRGHFVSGTHAISSCLFGVLRPGDELLSVTGTPYDTLQKVIGLKGNVKGTLRDWGIIYKQVDLTPGGEPDYPAIAQAINKNTRVVALQRSAGYQWRKALDIDTIAQIIRQVKTINSELICFVDNCYGEFVEEREPSEVGADLVAGSLIKNPGGGLAPTGGYVVGRADLIEQVAAALTAPGLGSDVGATLDMNRVLFQGLFLAPLVVREALKSAVFAARLFSRLGYEVLPAYNSPRADIVQGVLLGDREKVRLFCQGIQEASPVDARVTPVPWNMPGYQDEVIMAGGTFIQGSSIELSADAPMRPPYAVYVQGGLSFDYAKIALLCAAQKIRQTKG